MERQKYDVAVSYASEQRPYVERFVARLQSQKCVYTMTETHRLRWSEKFWIRNCTGSIFRNPIAASCSCQTHMLKSLLHAMNRRSFSLRTFSRKISCIFSSLMM